MWVSHFESTDWYFNTNLHLQCHARMSTEALFSKTVCAAATVSVCVCVSDTLQCIAEMLRIGKQALGLDLLVIEKRLERWVCAVG